MQDRKINALETRLLAKCIGSYSAGHTGAEILRFRRKADGVLLVVKRASLQNKLAMTDIAANVQGYRALAAIGAADLVPPDFEEFVLTTTSKERIVVMRDLGMSLRWAPLDGRWVEMLIEKVKWLVLRTMTQGQDGAHRSPSPAGYIQEVVSQLRRFPCANTEEVITAILNTFADTRPFPVIERLAIMPLDFTPYNVFLDESVGRLSFIDPWPQASYLGHPAVSLGQFATLARQYGIISGAKVRKTLWQFCVNELKDALDCSLEACEFAWRLGQTLQLMLSAYVRTKSEPAQSAEFSAQALALWRLVG